MTNKIPLTHRSVESYIISTDEYYKGYSNNTITIYRNKKDENLQVKIPLHQEYDDYTYVLNNALVSLANIENKSIDEIIEKISNGWG